MSLNAMVSVAKPTLASMPENIQVKIIAHLVVAENPIKLDPCSPPPTGISAGDLNIARASKHFHKVAIETFWAHNHFVLLPNETLYLPGPIHPKWISLSSSVPHPLQPESSVDCLSLLTQLPFASTSLDSLSAHLGACGITVFYLPLFTDLLSKLPLQIVEFVLIPGWTRILDPDYGTVFMEPGEKALLYPDFMAGFMRLVRKLYADVPWVLVRGGDAQGEYLPRWHPMTMTREEHILHGLEVAILQRNYSRDTASV